MPKSRKNQPAMSKKPRTETPPELEDAIAPELAEGETPTGTPNPGTYVVSEADTASGASSAREDNFVTPLPVVPAPTGKTSKAPAANSTPEPAPRLVDTADLLFSHSCVHSPGTISAEVGRGRAAHLRRRLDKLHRETLLGLHPEARSTSPPRPGTSRSEIRSTSPPRPGASSGQALTTAQLAQIKGYLQDQQLVLEDKGNGNAIAMAKPPAVTPPLFTLPLLPLYQSAFRNHFEGVPCKILRLSSSRYVILYLATYNRQCPLNCGIGPCDPANLFQHLAKEHPSALLLQCPTPGCGSSFFGVHQLFYHLLRAHDPTNNPLAPFIDNRLRICPYGGCSQDTRYTATRGGEHGSALSSHLSKNHQQSLATCNCGKEQFNAIRLLHHLWDSFPEITALYRRVELLLNDIRDITLTKGQLLTPSIPMSTALDVRTVDFNCKGLPNEIEFIDVPRRSTSVQAQRL